MIRLTFPLRRSPYVTQEWGENPDYYSQFSVDGVKLKGHNGIDLRTKSEDSPKGEIEVIASDNGFAQEVVDQGTKGYGKYIKIIHEWGESVYAHLKSFNIKQGDQVLRGQTIALSDNTGNSTGPHLHFGVRVNPYNRKDGWGGYSDPSPLLFSGESSEGLPQWLRNFLSEKQIDIGQAEPTIRDWCDKAFLYSAEKEKNTALNNDRSDIYEAVQLSKEKPIGDIVKKISLWQDGYLREDKTAKKHREFVENLAKRMDIEEMTEKAVLGAMKSLVVDKIDGKLAWWEYILLGLTKFFKKNGTKEI